jgi:rfaE bifunctional protein kinase chain/domain
MGPSHSQKISSLAEMQSNSSATESVLCYGHFNVIHPGHIRFLQYARSLGRHLTVAVIGDRLIPAAEKKRYFAQRDRAEGVAAIQYVDKVIILDELGLNDLVSAIKPKILVLGKEFENNRLIDLNPAMETVAKNNGKTVYHAGEVHYSSSDFLYSTTQDIENERHEMFLQACRRQSLGSAALVERIGKFKNCRILVIGDTIVDQYVACDAIGISAEAPVLVVKEIEAREFVGGAGVVAAHVRALGATCSFLSVLGNDDNAEFVKKELEKQGIGSYFVSDPSRPTTFKIRYMVDNQKLFRVSRLKEHLLEKQIEDQVISQLRALASNVDGILVCDFVYGVITNRIIKEIESLSSKYKIKVFGDVQCSSQVGSIAKFQNFDLLCPTEREARIALGNQHDGVEWIATQLLADTHAKNLIVKLGAEGFIAYSKEPSDDFITREHFPALISNPLDVAGAGDSLLAAVSVSMCSGASLMESSAIGACMAALAVQTVGNIPVTRQKLINYIQEMEQL